MIQPAPSMQPFTVTPRQVADSGRVVITGLGVIAPNGIGKENFWNNSVKASCFIRPITRFDATSYACRFGGEVDDFNATDFVKPKILKQTDRSTHMAMACCRMATEDGKLELSQEDPYEIGMYFANTFGGMEFAEPELYAQAFIGPDRVSAYQAIAWFYAATQGQWSISTGIRGFAKSIVADRSGGLQALGWATLAIRRGHCKVAYAGGFEAPLVPYAYLIHQTSRLLSTQISDPARAYMPFHRKRSGMVLGEGGGILLLEDLEHALNRGAPIYAELAGFAVSCDAYHSTDCAPDGEQLARCLTEAVESAGLKPEQIDHVCADGLGTYVGDYTEAAAINAVFGEFSIGPTVSAPKSMIGHTLAAAGAIDSIWACLMIKEGVLLPTINLDAPDARLNLDHVAGAPRRKQLNAVLCCGRGIGGLNTALVLRRFEG